MQNGLYILDVSKPDSISTVAWFDTIDEATSVAVHNDLIYVGDGFAGFYTLILNPTTPILISRFYAEADVVATSLRWEIAADEPISGFAVHRENEKGGGERVVSGDELLPSHVRTFADEDVEPGHNYYYTLVVVKPDGDEIRSNRIAVRVPATETRLLANYPNPFNPRTTIPFELAQQDRVSIVIYDVTGSLVTRLVDRRFSAGRNRVVWDGTNSAGAAVSSGMYIYRMTVGKQSYDAKMVLTK